MTMTLPAALRTPLVLVLALLFAAAARPATAAIDLPPHLASHMVVQAGQPLVITGRAGSRQDVAVTFAGETVRSRSDASGLFRLRLPPPAMSRTGRPLVVEAGTDRRVLEDVLVGEVWLCSGQSNMEWPMRATDGFDAARAASDRPLLRTFNARRVAAADGPRETIDGGWLISGPETVADFSGVAWHFGRELLDRLDAPIGLVHVSWGGSRAEAWMRSRALTRSEAGRRSMDAWNEYLATAGNDDDRRPADAMPGFDDSGWIAGRVPGRTAAFGVEDAVDGVFWIRIPLDVPAAWAGRELQLGLAMVDDRDVTFFAGERVGATDGWDRPRRYRVPGRLVTAGPTTIAVRVQDTGGPGGIHGEPEDLFVHPVDEPAARIDLAGPARLRIASRVSAMPDQHRPSQLWNGMVHPLRDLGLAGVIWYQGESNAMGPGSAADYADLLPGLIRDWRNAFGRPELPFHIVQLANLAYRVPDWDFPGVRDVQRQVLALPATGLAVTTDIGDADDIHPRNKRDVGNRLARWVLTDVYGVEGLVKSGPLVTTARRSPGGDAVLVRFDTFGSPLAGTTAGGFEVAGPRGVFVSVPARIDGSDVVRLSLPDDLDDPRRVRYAWRPDPVEADLTSASGLPAAAFDVRIDPGD